jgi:hypothetical protein
MSPMLAGAAVSQAKLEIVRVSCTAIRSTLQKISRGDISARINYGRTYDRAQKLLLNFDTRAQHNGRDIAKLHEINNKFNLEIQKFRAQYAEYEVELSNVTNINCADQPEEFYTALGKARGKRLVLGDTVRQFGALLAEYRAVFEVNFGDEL